MPMLSVLDKINIAKISQFLCLNDIDKKGLYGGGVDLQLPRKIYNIRKSVEWMYNNSPVVSEVRAVGELNVVDIGFNAVTITVYVNDPELGQIILGTYAKQPSDTNTTILAASIAAALDTNTYEYDVTSIDDVVYIEARPGLGSSINDDNRLYIELSTGLFDNSFDNTFN
jgi:hypothetical protein